MNRPPAEATLCLIVHALYRLASPCPVRILELWFPANRTLPEALSRLSFIRVAGGDVRLVPSPDLFRWLQGHPLAHLEETGIFRMGTVARALVQSARGRVYAAISLLSEYGLRRFSEAHWDEGIFVLRLCLMEMLDMDLSGADTEQLRTWNIISLLLMEAFLASPCRPLRPTLRLHARLHANASRMGDIRTGIVADVMLGLWFAMRCTCKKRYDALARALAAAEALGDSDMQALLVASRVIYHATRGDLNNCMQQHRRMQAAPGRIGNLYISVCASVVAAAASVLTGNIHEGLAGLERRLKKARQDNNRLGEMWLCTQLGNLLCSAGRPGDALRYLDRVLSCSSAFFMPMLHSFLFRVLAYYHYSRGAIGASYQCFRHTAFFKDALVARRSYYGYPWLLELLWEYRRAGLEDVPGYALMQVIARLWEGSNMHLQGAARRFEALLLEGEPGQEDRVLALLQESLARLEKVENQRELALTRRELARILTSAGRKDEALRYRKAADLFFASPSCSQHGLSCTALQSRMEEQARNVLEACEVSNDKKEYFNFFLQGLQQVLQCERSALFRILPHGGLQVLADNNLEASRSAAFTGGLLLMLENMEKLGRRFFVQGKSFVCLPSFRGERYLAYADNLYLESVLPQLGDHGLERLCWMFMTHFALAMSTQCLEQVQVRPEPVAAAEGPGGSARLYWENIPAPVRDIANRVAHTDVPVLLLGETGVGKEVLARYLHRHSGRRGKFVAIQPSSMTESLFESTLFGHEKGSFTGAVQQKIGLIEVAHEGTLFIDEVGDIPLSMQVKLLRVLQEKNFTRVGGIREQHSDFRIIGATHRDLRQMVQDGRFREDLYYRLAVIPINIPPLRGNTPLITDLAQKFALHYAQQHHVAFRGLDDETTRRLCAHSWPGNIRELKNFVERMVILSRDGIPGIGPREYPEGRSKVTEGLMDDLPSMETLKERYIRHVLQLTHNRICGPDGAESILKMKRSTLYAALHRYGLGRR